MENNPAFEELHPINRSWTRTILKLVALTIGLLVVAGAGIYWLARQTPEFYHASLRMSEEEAFEAGESLEVAALYLRNDVLEEETWVAEFEENQINGWLASDLPRKFGTQLFAGKTHAPRVGIEPDKFQIGLTTEIKGIETVVVAAMEFFPTEKSNQFGVHVLSVHAGWLPIPISFFTDPVTEMLRHHRIEVQWHDASDGAPVALLTIPKKKLSYQGHQIVVERLQIADGSVRLAGRSELLNPKSIPDPETVKPGTNQPDKTVAEVLPVSS